MLKISSKEILRAGAISAGASVPVFLFLDRIPSDSLENTEKHLKYCVGGSLVGGAMLIGADSFLFKNVGMGILGASLTSLIGRTVKMRSLFFKVPGNG